MLGSLSEELSRSFSQRAQNTITGMVASCSAHEAPQGREIFLGTLMPSEGSETAEGKSPYLEKTENHYQRTKYHKGNEEKSRKVILGHFGGRKVQPWKSELPGNPDSQAQSGRPGGSCPAPHCTAQGPEVHPGWTATASTPSLADATFSCEKKEHDDGNDRSLHRQIWGLGHIRAL